MRHSKSGNTNRQPTTQLFFPLFRTRPPDFPPFLSTAANLPRFCCPMRQKWQFLIKLFSFSFFFFIFLPHQKRVGGGGCRRGWANFQARLLTCSWETVQLFAKFSYFNLALFKFLWNCFMNFFDPFPLFKSLKIFFSLFFKFQTVNKILNSSEKFMIYS